MTPRLPRCLKDFKLKRDDCDSSWNNKWLSATLMRLRFGSFPTSWADQLALGEPIDLQLDAVEPFRRFSLSAVVLPLATATLVATWAVQSPL